MWFLGLAILANATMRMVQIISGLMAGAVPDLYDAPHYFEHLPLTLLHLVPGLVFIGIGPLQFSRRARHRWPALHRISGRVWALSGLFLGAAGIVMNEVFPPVGGPLKYVSTHLFGGALIVCISLGVLAAVRGRVGTHRRWMVRAFAIGLAPSTQRLLFFPVFAATGRVDEVMIDVVMSVGWVVNVVVGELILRRWPGEPG